MAKRPTERAIASYLRTVGFDRARKVLDKAEAREAKKIGTLTIIANHGLHHIPPRFLRGEVFVLSRGTLDLSNAKQIQITFTRLLRPLAQKLRAEQWRRIYIIPTGHPTLSMQAKLLVFRITRIESTEVFYLGNGRYLDLSLDQRRLILSK
jgi:hypothetical protein